VTTKGDEIREAVRAMDDRRFDLAYPKSVRAVSGTHWTPLKVAVRAAEFLVRGPETRVLDIGCGPGKFCIAGALAIGGHFTGVDRRGRLCEVGRALATRAGVSNVEFRHANVTELSFEGFDAFYLFNPFAENLGMAPPIDETVSLSAAHYAEFTSHVARQLALAPLGTRVVTYFGACEDIPMGFSCVGSALTSELRFWEKTRFHPDRAPGEGV
jgi:SAM-dependent methyltransferase